MPAPLSPWQQTIADWLGYAGRSIHEAHDWGYTPSQMSMLLSKWKEHGKAFVIISRGVWAYRPEPRRAYHVGLAGRWLTDRAKPAPHGERPSYPFCQALAIARRAGDQAVLVEAALEHAP